MRLTEFEQQASERLDMAVQLSCSESPASRYGLSAGEHARLDAFRYPQRRQDWLTGRAALKALLRRQARSADTAAIEFPAPQWSLTHAGGIALAAGTCTGTARIGIDYEVLRDVNSRMARWFLDDTEQAWLAGLGDASAARQLIRLWTIKEAAFKTHPGNQRMLLGDFSISDPAARGVVNVRSNRGLRIRVHCDAYRRGYLSIAGVQA